MAADRIEDLPKPPVEDDVTEETSLDESKVADESSSDPAGSRKREREVSLEPPTPTAAESLAPSEIKERRDAKKNRVQLTTTTEEDETPPPSPEKAVLSSSPPHESKVRMIRERVRGINWEDTTMQENGDAEAREVTEANESADVSATPPEEAEPKEEVNGDGSEDKADSEDDDGKTRDVKAPSLTAKVVPPITPTESTKRPREDADSDDNPRQNKRPTPPPEEAKVAKPAVEESTTEDKIPPPTTSPTESTKRPRDDADKDDNPRQAKRPTPPPEETKAATPATKSEDTAAAKPGGFLAYTSTSSPFASTKGTSVFKSSPFASTSAAPSSPGASSSKAAPSAGAKRAGFEAFASSSSPFAPASKSALGTNASEDSTASTGVKRSGFEAFASSSSPFAARAKSPPVFGASSGIHRNKSPPRRSAAALSAFSSYTGSGSSPFAAPPVKKPRQEESGDEGGDSEKRPASRNAFSNGAEDSGEDSEKPITFGERLRAGKDDEASRSDDEAKPSVTEQEVTTGEEDEETVFQVRGKLYALSDRLHWTERGTGLLKLNVKQTDGSGARLVMRKEAVYSLLLNVTLFKGMKCTIAQDPRYVRFSTIESGTTVHYNLRVSNAKVAEELLEEINSHTPSDEPHSIV